MVTDALGSGYRFLGAITLSTALRFGAFDRAQDLAQRLSEGLSDPIEPIAAILDFASAAQGRPTFHVADAAQRLARAGLVTAAIDGAALVLSRPAPEDVRRRLRSVIGELTSRVDAPLLQKPEAPPLTPREREVAYAAADRLGSREIAEMLGITHRTVENQLHSVYRKLGVTSRVELREALRVAGISPHPA